uniref:Uncharacterized protein n=1 Tax=Oryzias sinensis TaxID=183150 RepID=A0A8C7YE01_9TELE
MEVYDQTGEYCGTARGSRTDCVVSDRYTDRAPVKPRPLPASSIDLQRVQGLVEEMGATLSPGAQNLMEMVQFQQQVSKAAAILPSQPPPTLKLGGCDCPCSHVMMRFIGIILASGRLTRGALRLTRFFFQSSDSSSSAELTPLAENGEKSEGSAPPAPPHLNGNKSEFQVNVGRAGDGRSFSSWLLSPEVPAPRGLSLNARLFFQ